MKRETFFEKFELFADAPGAVAKMRGVILDFAAQGLLSERKSKDGHASDIVDAIADERAHLTKKKLIRKQPTLSEIDELHFDIPPSWTWVRLGNCVPSYTDDFVDGPFGSNLKADEYIEHGMPIVRLKNIGRNQFKTKDIKFISNRKAEELKRHNFKPGDLLLNKLGDPVGKCCIAPEEIGTGIIVADVIRLRLSERWFSPRFVSLVINSPAIARQLLVQITGITRDRVSLEKLRGLAIPLPPLAEQKRIVAKVDELMALCDRLEAQQQARDSANTALARASLARFAEAPTPVNLQFLFHPSYTISLVDLRKSILTLAVQGKLVSQDPNDEPALALLDQIAAHKTALAKAGKLRGSTTVKPMADGEAEFELPSNWSWVRFSEIMVNRDGERIPVSKEERETKAKTYDYYGASGVIDKIDGYLFDKPLLLIGEDGANLINRSTPIAFIARGKYWVNNHAHVLDGISEDFLRFIELHINAINLEKYVTGSAQPKMNQAKMNSIPIALPPLAEQRRIVAKVDQLMALVDQLEAQLTTAKEKGAALLDALIHELLNPSAEVIDLASYRAAVGCKVIRKMQDKPYFGHVAAMKALYLAEAHVGLPLKLKPMRYIAGPYDPWIDDFEKEGIRNNWFNVVKRSITGDRTKASYQPGRALADKCAQVTLKPAQQKELDRLLALLTDKTTEEAEIIATLFAAWNDFLIDGHSPSDDEIVREVRENWHEKKIRFSPAKLSQWLGWLRENNLIPTGRPPRTIQQTQMFAHSVQ